MVRYCETAKFSNEIDVNGNQSPLKVKKLHLLSAKSVKNAKIT